MPTKLLIIVSLFFFSCRNIKVENYYLPLGFTGNVAIIYNKNGLVPKDTTNIIIPETGILFSSLKFTEGDYYINYYQKNENNSYDTLYELLPGKNSDSGVNKIVFPRVLTFQKLKEQTSYTVSTFYVGKKIANDLAKDRFIFERKLEELLLK